MAGIRKKFVSLISGLLSRLGRSKSAPDTEHYADAADRLTELRGDKVTALPADRRKSSIENVTEAAKDYGLSRFSGETDSMSQAAGGYRSARKRRKRGKRRRE